MSRKKVYLSGYIRYRTAKGNFIEHGGSCPKCGEPLHVAWNMSTGNVADIHRECAHRSKIYGEIWNVFRDGTLTDPDAAN